MKRIGDQFLNFKMIAALVFCVAMVIPASSFARVHTWAPRKVILQDGSTVLPVVVITGSRIQWNFGEFDDSIFDDSIPRPGGGGWNSSLGQAILSSRDRALDASDVCKNPAVSTATKQATGSSDVTDRWLAAQDLFRQIQLSNLWTFYGQATGGIVIIIDTKQYTGFRVTYRDGSKETWLVNPGFRTSSFALFDTPAPSSLIIPSAPRATCAV